MKLAAYLALVPTRMTWTAYPDLATVRKAKHSDRIQHVAVMGKTVELPFVEFDRFLRDLSVGIYVKGTGPSWSPTRNTDGHRRNSSTVGMYALVVECDDGTDPMPLSDALGQLDVAHWLVESGGSYSVTSAKPVHKWKLIIPYSTPWTWAADVQSCRVAADHHKYVYRCLLDDLTALAGYAHNPFDSATCSTSNAVYHSNPRDPRDPPRKIEYIPGKYGLDVVRYASDHKPQTYSAAKAAKANAAVVARTGRVVYIDRDFAVTCGPTAGQYAGQTVRLLDLPHGRSWHLRCPTHGGDGTGTAYAHNGIAHCVKCDLTWRVGSPPATKQTAQDTDDAQAQAQAYEIALEYISRYSPRQELDDGSPRHAVDPAIRAAALAAATKAAQIAPAVSRLIAPLHLHRGSTCGTDGWTAVTRGSGQTHARIVLCGSSTCRACAAKAISRKVTGALYLPRTRTYEVTMPDGSAATATLSVAPALVARETVYVGIVSQKTVKTYMRKWATAADPTDTYVAADVADGTLLITTALWSLPATKAERGIPTGAMRALHGSALARLVAMPLARALLPREVATPPPDGVDWMGDHTEMVAPRLRTPHGVGNLRKYLRGQDFGIVGHHEADTIHEIAGELAGATEVRPVYHDGEYTGAHTLRPLPPAEFDRIILRLSDTSSVSCQTVHEQISDLVDSL